MGRWGFEVAIVLVQKIGVGGVGGFQSTGTVGSISPSFDSASTSGNLIAVGVIHYQVGTYTVTDTVNTYTQDVTVTTSNDTASVWHTYATTGATLMITVTNTGGNKYTSIGAAEFSGVDSGTSPLTNSDNPGSTSTTAYAGSVDSTSLGNGALYFAAHTHSNGTVSITPAGGFTEVYENENASNQPISTIYQVQGTAGALNPSWTMGSAVTSPGCVAVFKATAGGGGGGSPVGKFFFAFQAVQRAAVR